MTVKKYRFGVKVSIATNLRASRERGKHFLVYTNAMYGRLYDVHTLEKARENVEKIIGRLPGRFWWTKDIRDTNGKIHG